MAYTRVNWEDLPSTDTPINATNLNKMDEGIYDNSLAIDNAIESGSNENGSYIKFNDGTLICRATINTSANESEKNIYFSTSFINSSFNVIVTNIYSNSKKVIWTVTNTDKEYFTAFPMSYETNSVPTSASSANYIAIGRWK